MVSGSVCVWQAAGCQPAQRRRRLSHGGSAAAAAAWPGPGQAASEASPVPECCHWILVWLSLRLQARPSVSPLFGRFHHDVVIAPRRPPARTRPHPQSAVGRRGADPFRKEPFPSELALQNILKFGCSLARLQGCSLAAPIPTMPRRQSQQSGKSDGVFGALGGSSHRSNRSIKEVFGNISEGTSQVMRSIKEKFSSSPDDKDHSSDGSNNPRAGKAGRKSTVESKKNMKSGVDQGSKQSRRSKADKSHQSKRGLRSGIVRDGRLPQNRGIRFILRSKFPAYIDLIDFHFRVW
jgi:hypothetical protein